MNIVLVGQMGSGKDLVAEHLKESGYTSYKLGKYIRKHIDEMFPRYAQDKRRHLYQEYGEGMRMVFGTYFWCERVVSQIEEDGNGGKFGFKDNLMITDARQPHEIAFWTSHGFVPVGVETREDLRLSRLMQRDGANFTEDVLNHYTELSVKQIIKEIKDGKLEGIVIDNSDTIDKTLFQVNQLVLGLEYTIR